MYRRSAPAQIKNRAGWDNPNRWFSGTKPSESTHCVIGLSLEREERAILIAT
jgi:hypothetical protein